MRQDPFALIPPLMLACPRGAGWHAAALRTSIATIAATIAFAACGSDSTGPQQVGCGTTPAGTVTAAVDGQPFTATLLAQTTIQNSTANGPNLVQLTGAECPTTGGASRQILITLGRLTPITAGTYQLNAASQGLPAGSGYTGIGQFSLAPNLWYTNLSDATGPGSGSVTFTTISATRIVGTFQLQTVANSANATTARQRVVITNGAFDIGRP